MDSVWQELIRAVPWGAVIIILRYMEIKGEAEARKERAINAQAKGEQDRQTQVVVAQAYAGAINALSKATEASSANITASVNEFKAAVLEQYRKMGTTQELVETAIERAMEATKKAKE